MTNKIVSSNLSNEQYHEIRKLYLKRSRWIQELSYVYYKTKSLNSQSKPAAAGSGR